VKVQVQKSVLKMISITDIEVLNPRERNTKIFEDIVGNIKRIGLKKPITVTPRKTGEGLIEQGYDRKSIASKTGLSIDYVQGILHLLEYGEDRLLIAVESGKIPLNVALEICSAEADDKAIQVALHDAYESGQLRGKQLIHARKLIVKRQTLGKAVRPRSKVRTSSEITSSSLVRSYQREVERQKIFIKKSDYTQQRLLFVIGALRSLLSNENFVTLLRAENLDTVPSFIADRVWPNGHAL